MDGTLTQTNRLIFDAFNYIALRYEGKKYTEADYHKPSDEVKPYWDLSGMVEDLQLLFSVGYRVANAEQFPAWSPGTEFKAKRDAMLNAAQKH